MSGWESWLIGISVAIIAVAFAVLVVFLIRTLLNLGKSLQDTSRLIQDTNHLVLDVEKKLHSFDPLFKTVANLSDVIEKQTTKSLSDEVCTSYVCDKERKIERTAKTAIEVMEWALVGYSLWQKFKERK